MYKVMGFAVASRGPTQELWRLTSGAKKSAETSWRSRVETAQHLLNRRCHLK